MKGRVASGRATLKDGALGILHAIRRTVILKIITQLFHCSSPDPQVLAVTVEHRPESPQSAAKLRNEKQNMKQDKYAIT